MLVNETHGLTDACILFIIASGRIKPQKGSAVVILDNTIKFVAERSPQLRDGRKLFNETLTEKQKVGYRS